MTDLSAIIDHTLFIEYTCGRVVAVPVADVRGCVTTDDVQRKSVCRVCGARVAPVIGLRVVYQRPGDR